MNHKCPPLSDEHPCRMPEKHTTPSRFHSARRNKKWQVMTLLGAVLIVALGVSSEFRRMIALIPRRYPVMVISQYSGLSVGVALYQGLAANAHFEISTVSSELRQRHTARDRIVPAFALDGMGPLLHLPYWIFLVAFLVIQYLLLPKSLPVTEESERTDA